MANKIMIVGPSGIGKTTIAKAIAEKWGLDFISTSMSDLLPETKEIPQVKLMQDARNSKGHYLDVSLLKARRDLLVGQDNYVCDRSFIDNMAYFLLKFSEKAPDEVVDSFMAKAKEYLLQTCDMVIFMPLVLTDIDSEGSWGPIENNSKRIASVNFQWVVSEIMASVILYRLNFDPSNNEIHIPGGRNIPVLWLHETTFDDRMEIINNFIGLSNLELE